MHARVDNPPTVEFHSSEDSAVSYASNAVDFTHGFRACSRSRPPVRRISFHALAVILFNGFDQFVNVRLRSIRHQSMAMVLTGSGTPSGVRTAASFSAALRNLGLKLRTPNWIRRGSNQHATNILLNVTLCYVALLAS